MLRVGTWVPDEKWVRARHLRSRPNSSGWGRFAGATPPPRAATRCSTSRGCRSRARATLAAAAAEPSGGRPSPSPARCARQPSRGSRPQLRPGFLRRPEEERVQGRSSTPGPRAQRAPPARRRRALRTIAWWTQARALASGRPRTSGIAPGRRASERPADRAVERRGGHRPMSRLSLGRAGEHVGQLSLFLRRRTATARSPRSRGNAALRAPTNN